MDSHMPPRVLILFGINFQVTLENVFVVTRKQMCKECVSRNDRSYNVNLIVNWNAILQVI